MDMSSWGPLAHFAGNWKGDQGRDFAHSYSKSAGTERLYREEVSLEPLGPVDNGTQSLYGLDYRMKAWPIGEDEPFHMEVGYWLWDAESRLVMRSVMVPRGVTLIATGEAGPDAMSFTLRAEKGDEVSGILQNPYLMRAARTIEYEVTLTVGEDGSFAYTQDILLEMRVQPGVFHHTDQNTLTKA